MKKKALFISFWLIAAFFLLPGGNSSWQQSLQIKGHVTTGPAPAVISSDTVKESQEAIRKEMDSGKDEKDLSEAPKTEGEINDDSLNLEGLDQEEGAAIGDE